MEYVKIELLDEIEMKKPHPCASKSHRFQVIMLGADLKLQCLGCGNIILITRLKFNQKLKRVISQHETYLFKK